MLLEFTLFKESQYFFFVNSDKFWNEGTVSVGLKQLANLSLSLSLSPRLFPNLELEKSRHSMELMPTFLFAVQLNPKKACFLLFDQAKS